MHSQASPPARCGDSVDTNTGIDTHARLKGAVLAAVAPNNPSHITRPDDHDSSHYLYYHYP